MADDDLILRAQLRDELSGGLRNIRRELQRTEAAASGLGITAEKQVSRGLDVASSASKRLQGEALSLHRNLLSLSQSAGATLVSGVKRGTAALGILGGAMGVFGLKSAGNIQTANVAFEALLGSASEGKRVFGEIQKMNLKSPFQLGDLTKAGQDLLGSTMAADDALKVLKSLGDIAALSTAPTENLLALSRATRQVSDTGKLTAQDALQFSNAGVNIYRAIADSTGKSVAEVRKLGEEGKISADVVMRVLTNYEGLLGKFKGGAEKANKTLFGQFSNLKDQLMVKLSDTAGPLTASLTKSMPALIKVVGDGAEKIGAPLFGLIGKLAESGAKLLPALAPPIAALFGGLGRLLDAGAPALAMLGPLSEKLSGSISGLVDQLLPVLPDVVDLLFALMGVLPDVVKGFGAMILMTMPLVRLATELLKFEPVRKIMAGLLITLLGYRAIAGISSGLWGFAAALKGIGNEAETAGQKASIAQGKLAALGAIGAGGAGVVTGLPGATKGQSAGADLGFIASTTTLGAGIGSVVPVVGTGVGAFSGAVLGAGFVGARRLKEKFFGDPVVPGGILASHNAANAAAGSGSMRQITSGIRGHDIRTSQSGHARGTAVDVTGPGLASYAESVRSRGGWAVLEGAGAGMHAHADFGDPATGTGTRSGSGLTRTARRAGDILNINLNGPINGQIDYERGLDRALERVERRRKGRSYEPVYARHS